eukprot:comp22508_c0_seq1/m.34100 comp22508_c0_seq1/g.34100  ORF comp22508_c0_seq1/g.34100 comp22508_c0_seq1/m.34100 type:complete len:448 (-) comp22508_c0_seq1:396-1739(-)
MSHHGQGYREGYPPYQQDDRSSYYPEQGGGNRHLAQPPPPSNLPPHAMSTHTGASVRTDRHMFMVDVINRCGSAFVVQARIGNETLSGVLFAASGEGEASLASQAFADLGRVTSTMRHLDPSKFGYSPQPPPPPQPTQQLPTPSNFYPSPNPQNISEYAGRTNRNVQQNEWAQYSGSSPGYDQSQRQGQPAPPRLPHSAPPAVPPAPNTRDVRDVLPPAPQMGEGEYVQMRQAVVSRDDEGMARAGEGLKRPAAGMNGDGNEEDGAVPPPAKKKKKKKQDAAPKLAAEGTGSQPSTPIMAASEEGKKPKSDSKKPPRRVPGVCENCHITETSLWRRVNGIKLCNPCGLYFYKHKEMKKVLTDPNNPRDEKSQFEPHGGPMEQHSPSAYGGGKTDAGGDYLGAPQSAQPGQQKGAISPAYVENSDDTEPEGDLVGHRGQEMAGYMPRY